jgi:DNA polymerase-3 subunit gamma/tau
MAWYNTYRPTKFDDVIGQDLVKQIMQKSIETAKIKHAYLLSGPKGVGKTTLARIFAYGINGYTSTDQEEGSNMKFDLVEMDAASNTGIDDIRELIENAKLPPMHNRYKIYIIDEVHMLSKSAMNALLKILEEPPSYLVFLLATTNPEKILPTVLSRLTKLPLESHTIQGISNKLKSIATAEKLNIDPEAIELIAKRSGGGQRDAINTLETVASYNLEKYDYSSVAKILGVIDEEILYEVVEFILK